MKFEEWLRKQLTRDSPLGDLARDYIADGSPENFTMEYLQSRTSNSDIIDTYRAAKKSYRNYQSRKRKSLLNATEVV